MSLGENELKDIIENDGKAELVCSFCQTKYVFNEDELRALKGWRRRQMRW